MSCKICDSEALDTIGPTRDVSTSLVVRCTSCGCVQQAVFPTVGEDKEFYDGNRQARWVQNLDLESIESKLRDDTVRRCNLIAQFPRTARIADIGTGYGFLVRELRGNGFEIDGYEISSERRRIAEQVTGGSIFGNNLLESAELPEEKYDVVTLFQVLEHISTPMLFLSRLRSMMAPKGTIVIEVPNHADWMIEENAAYRAFYYQRAHLFYYDQSSLSNVLTRSGFGSWKFDFVQRYSLSNAFHWIVNNKPQIESPKHFETGALESLDSFYRSQLITSGKTDTLIATLHHE